MILGILITIAVTVLIYVVTRKPPKIRSIVPGDAIFITGCDTGFGNLLAKRLDSSGYCVFAACLNKDTADVLDKETSEKLVTIQCDVTKQEDIDAALEKVKITCTEKSWNLIGVVNNAGIVTGLHVEFTEISEYEKCLAINTMGAIRVSKAFIPMLKKTKGRIVNMCSILGLSSNPLTSVYCTSKFALDGFTRVLRMDLKPFGIKAIVINPGGFSTPLWNLYDRLRSDFNSKPEFHEEYGKDYVNKIIEVLESYPLGDAKVVVDAMMLALTSEKPQPRYIVGYDAAIQRYLTLLPDEWYDWIHGVLVRFPKPAVTLK